MGREREPYVILSTTEINLKKKNYNSIFSLFLLHYFISKRQKQRREEKSIIQTNNHANLKRYSKSPGAAERQNLTPPACCLSRVYQGRGRGRGRIPVAGKRIYLVHKVTRTAALNCRLL